MLNFLKGEKNDANANSVHEDLLSSAAISPEMRRAQAWLEDRLARGRREAFTETGVLLTIELAELLLKRNPDNRKWRELKLANYIADMKAGAWEENGESIKMSKCGYVNDGQHRCRGVIESGCPIRVDIRFGLERETRMSLDQGAPRTCGDYLSMEGIENANALAAAANLLWQYQTRRNVSYMPRMKATRQQCREIIAFHPSLQESVRKIPARGSNLAGGSSILAFCHYLFAMRDREKADFFISKLVDGDGLAKRDPIYLCRERLHASKKLKIDEKAELLFRAWNAWLLNRMNMHKIQLSGGPELPAIEG